ncbi:MAG: NAD(P)-binding domain-containing protein, partial [Kiritimatiellaeota bacterium]|nr:NAD(P)-binding domain-containing protein [Kiritimatiellota bacterium]
MKIGWIGTGVMGTSMVRRLHDAGHDCFIFSRTKKKAEPLLSAGMEWKDSPAKAAVDADVVCSMVGAPDDVREVALEADGVLSAIEKGAVFIDFTTSSPELAKEIHARFAERGASALDAPVSGGDVGARNGTLSIMAGGDTSAFDAALPLFKLLGKTVKLQGAPGSGQHA